MCISFKSCSFFLAWSKRNVFNLFIIKCYKPPINVSRAKTICQHMFMSTQSRQLRRKLNISRPNRTRAPWAPIRTSLAHLPYDLAKRIFENTAFNLRFTFDLQVHLFSYPWNTKLIIGNTPRAIIAEAKVLMNTDSCLLCSKLLGNGESIDKLSSGCWNILNGFLRAVGPSANSSKWALFQLPSLLKIVFALKSI